MRLPIFWRALLVQFVLIGLTLLIGFYAFVQLQRLTALSADALGYNSARMEEEKKLVAIFLAQMRSAEKYVVLRDQAFLDSFTQGSQDFERTIEKLRTVLDTPEEHARMQEISDLYTRYANALAGALTRKSSWAKEKSEITDGITANIDQLMQLHEQAVVRRTAAVRDQAAAATRVVSWLMLGGVSLAALLAYLNARGISRPLKKLTREMNYVGEGEFHRSVTLKAPKEVSELAHSFNAMVSQLAKLDDMKADFIAHVSHDLRTPLTAIREGIALLLEEIPGSLASSQREVIEVMRTHSERLSLIIGSVLDLSKMEAGMMEYARVPCDMNRLIDHSIDTVGLIAQKKQISLQTVSPAPLPFLLVDEGKIQQVLDNLLLNAVKFTPEGGTIQVAATVTAKENSDERHVVVRVIDTGNGIPVAELERVFEKFYQSPSHRHVNQRGTGLGLAIARHIINAHDGKIWAESEVGKGATFCFALPVKGVVRDERSLASASSMLTNTVEGRV